MSVEQNAQDKNLYTKWRKLEEIEGRCGERWRVVASGGGLFVEMWQVVWQGKADTYWRRIGNTNIELVLRLSWLYEITMVWGRLMDFIFSFLRDRRVPSVKGSLVQVRLLGQKITIPLVFLTCVTLIRPILESFGFVNVRYSDHPR